MPLNVELGYKLHFLLWPLFRVAPRGHGFVLRGAQAHKWWYRNSAGWSLNPDWCSHLKLKAATFYVACFSALTSLWCNFCFRCSLPSWVRLVWNWPGSSRDCSVKLQILGPYWKSLTHIRGEKWQCYLGFVGDGGRKTGCRARGRCACWQEKDGEVETLLCLLPADDLLTLINPVGRGEEWILGNLKTW